VFLDSASFYSGSLGELQPQARVGMSTTMSIIEEHPNVMVILAGPRIACHYGYRATRRILRVLPKSQPSKTIYHIPPAKSGTLDGSK
jgi:hypothetical protein